MRAIFEQWDAEGRWLRATLRRMRPRPREEDIDDCILAMAEKLWYDPPRFESLLHGRRWMRLVCRRLLRDGWRYSKKFRVLDEATELESIEDWLTGFEDEDLMRAALGMLDEENAELLELYISGLSITVIAELQGFHRTTLQMRFRHIHGFLRENLR